MDSLLMTFLSPKTEESSKSTRRVRDVVSPIKSFENTRKRLQLANTRSLIQPQL